MNGRQAAGSARLKFRVEKFLPYFGIDYAADASEEFYDSDQAEREGDGVKIGFGRAKDVGEDCADDERDADGRAVYAIAYMFAGATILSVPHGV